MLTGMAMVSQFDRVVLAGHNVADDRQTGLTGDVADNIVQLNVHQAEGLLHPLDVGGPVADEIIPMAGV